MKLETRRVINEMNKFKYADRVWVLDEETIFKDRITAIVTKKINNRVVVYAELHGADTRYSIDLLYKTKKEATKALKELKTGDIINVKN